MSQPIRIRKTQKYNNVRTEGCASKREWKRYEDLKMLERAGEISDLQFQVPFRFEKLRYASGRPLTYIADFVYFENGQRVVEDSKGFRTAVYRIKKLLMEHFYNVEILET